jgi:hypothetical protein
MLQRSCYTVLVLLHPSIQNLFKRGLSLFLFGYRGVDIIARLQIVQMVQFSLFRVSPSLFMLYFSSANPWCVIAVAGLRFHLRCVFGCWVSSSLLSYSLPRAIVDLI